MKQNYTALWAELMIEELVRQGVTDVCVCPGSRSTPLTVAAARHAKVKPVRAYDERGAAFLALGYARATGKPMPVITTSGSALANLYPAVVEASLDHVPMILLTADRPPELTDCGANQAIQQTHLFAPYVRWQFELPCPTGDVDPPFVLTTMDQAMSRAKGYDAGPVHINCPYREPFWGPQDVTVSNVPGMRTWGGAQQALTRYAEQVMTTDLSELVKTVDGTQRGLLIVGQLTTEAERTAVRSLTLKLNWPVYADIRSGLRLEFGTHVMRYFDQERLSAGFCEAVRPEIVLHLGSRVVSKRVPLYFADYPPEHYVFVNAAPERQDPIQGVTQRLSCDIAWFAERLAEALEPQAMGDYLDRFDGLAAEAHKTIHRAIDDNATLTEVYVANRLTELVPAGTALFVANSMPVRDVDIYGTLDRLDDFPVAVNRGASGIDGTLASALGFAQGHRLPATVLVGDQAFIHDLNSLSLIREIDSPVIIVLINNHGGGIFHFLPIAEQTDVFGPYFKMPHAFGFAGACQSFGIAHVEAQDKEGFDAAYKQAVRNEQTTVIEVVTDSEVNFKVRRQLKEELLKLFVL